MLLLSACESGGGGDEVGVDASAITTSSEQRPPSGGSIAVNDPSLTTPGEDVVDSPTTDAPDTGGTATPVPSPALVEPSAPASTPPTPPPATSLPNPPPATAAPTSPTPAPPPVPGKDAEPQTVFNVSEVVSATVERTRLQTNYRLTDFSATGLYLPPNTTLTVEVEMSQGTRPPTLLIGTYSRYKAKSNPTSLALKAGSNTISDPDGGLLWIRYVHATPDSSAKVSFVSGATPAPYYVLGKTSKEQWKTMLTTLTTPDVVLQGARCFVVVGRDKAQKFVDEDQNKALQQLELIARTEDEISGQDGSSSLHRPNIHGYLLVQHDDPDSYFYATDYRTAYAPDSLDAILSATSLSTYNWGVWHELGHQHQQVWSWSGMGEVTVNIYSLAVQRKIQPGKSRLTDSGAWPKAFTYLAKADDDKDFNGTPSPADASKTLYPAGLTDVFLRLCMFEQLRLAFGDEFYQRLHKTTREERPTLADSDAKMRYFMLLACRTSGRNLAVFFRRWGLRMSTSALTTSVYNEMNNLGLPLPSSDPSTLQN